MQDEGLQEVLQLLLERALEARPQSRGDSDELMQPVEPEASAEEVLLDMAASLCRQVYDLPRLDLLQHYQDDL